MSKSEWFATALLFTLIAAALVVILLIRLNGLT